MLTHVICGIGGCAAYAWGRPRSLGKVYAYAYVWMDGHWVLGCAGRSDLQCAGFHRIRRCRWGARGSGAASRKRWGMELYPPLLALSCREGREGLLVSSSLFLVVGEPRVGRCAGRSCACLDVCHRSVCARAGCLCMRTDAGTCPRSIRACCRRCGRTFGD
ncbi:hypothetical protein B0H13DRAFT_193460 [Mycena leptocephala]|nr:hypothetical protein B0H13DRAFT_193460 [Mycena leptocephala]